MADSSLVCYENYDVPHDSGRTSGVGCIGVHHFVGEMAFPNIAQMWRRNQASTHYVIRCDGSIGQFVKESDCAWALGDSEANNFSINIECCNDGGADTDWHVSEATIEACISLIVDICKRHGWTQFRYSGDDQNGELIAHRWYMPTACPGNYLYSQFPRIAAEVQARLTPQPATPYYRVRKTWEDKKSQVGAFKKLENAKNKCDEYPGYSVYDNNGTSLYTSEEKKEEPTPTPTPTPDPKPEPTPTPEPKPEEKYKSIFDRLFKKYGKGAGK